MKRNKKIAALIGAIIAICTTVFLTTSAIAKDYAVAPSTNTILRKAMLEDAYYAYNSYHLSNEITPAGYNGIGSIAKSSSKYNLPLVYTNKKNAKSSEFFAGKDGLAGVFEFFGVDSLTSQTGGGVTTAQKTDFLAKAGYTKQEVEDDDTMQGEMCVKFFYTVFKFGPLWGNRGTYSAYSDYLCVKTTATPSNSDGTMSSSDYINAVIQDDPYIKSSGDQPDKNDIPNEKPIVLDVWGSLDKVSYNCRTMADYFSMTNVTWYDFATGGLSKIAGDAIDSIGLGMPVGVWGFINARECSESTGYVVGTTTFGDLVSGIMSDLSSMSGEAMAFRQDFWDGEKYLYAFGSNNYSQGVNPDEPFALIGDVASADEMNATYELTASSKDHAMDSLVGGDFVYDNTNYGSRFTRSEKFILYDAYIKEVYEIDEQLAEDTTLSTSGYEKTRLINSQTGDISTVYVKPKNKSVSGLAKVTDDYHFSPTETVTFSEVASYLLNETSVDHVDPEVLAQYAPAAPGESGSTEDGTADGGEVEENCYTSAGSLGWILCPIIEQGAETVGKVYGYVSGFMQINTNLFNRDDDSKNGTYLAWDVFRNIANVAFVIVFLFVIFSQLTGIGLDNYGIKKVLPKLIIGAILINLSYIICQLAVDVANIVGYGLKGLFNGMQNQMLSNAGGIGIDLLGDGTGMTQMTSDIVGTTGLIVIIVGVIAGAAFLASSGGSLLVPILLGIITILISIVSFMIMLAIRQALAVILVVVSPLAFVCYMLPNTKGVFKKWFDTMKGMLLAFPICSAIVYGSEMVATILLIANANGGADGKSVTNFALALSAAVVSIVPVFLVPKAITKSMGAIGGAVDRLGRMGRGVAHRGFNNSALRKNLDYSSKLRRAGLKVGKDGTLQFRGGAENKKPRTKYGKMKLDSLRSEVANDVIARGGAGRYSEKEGLDRLNSRIYTEQEKEEKYKTSGTQSQIMLGHADAVDEHGNIITRQNADGKTENVKIDPNSVTQLEHALTEAMRQNDTDKIKALQNILTAKGDPGREAVRRATEAFEHEIYYKEDGIGADGKMKYEFDQEAYDNMDKKHRDAIKTAADNIMDNHAKDYKENNRSMFDWAKSNSGTNTAKTPQLPEESVNWTDEQKKAWISANVQTLSGAHSSMGVGSVKQSQLLNMDDAELERFAGATGDMTGAQRDQLSGMISAALGSEAASGAKNERLERLKQISEQLRQQNAGQLGALRGQLPDSQTLAGMNDAQLTILASQMQNMSQAERNYTNTLIEQIVDNPPANMNQTQIDKFTRLRNGIAPNHDWDGSEINPQQNPPQSGPNHP